MRNARNGSTAVGLLLLVLCTMAFSFAPFLPPIKCVEDGVNADGNLKCLGDCGDGAGGNQCRSITIEVEEGEDYQVCTCDGTEPLCCHVRFIPGDPAVVNNGGNCIQCGQSGFCKDNDDPADPEVGCG